MYYTEAADYMFNFSTISTNELHQPVEQISQMSTSQEQENFLISVASMKRLAMASWKLKNQSVN